MAMKAAAKKTRDQLEEIIKRGESVIHNGEIITKIEDLPTEAELVLGNPALEKVTADVLDAQIARLQAERDKLTQAAANGGKLPEPAGADTGNAADAKPADDGKAAQRQAILGDTTPKADDKPAK
jgi:hypothetical protein